MLSGVVGATSPGATARVAACPRQHAAAAAVSDARRVILRSHGAQFTFLVPSGRVDAALAPGLLTWAPPCLQSPQKPRSTMVERRSSHPMRSLSRLL
eukprot:1460287-Karenia_brevis.AAC.1